MSGVCSSCNDPLVVVVDASDDEDDEQMTIGKKAPKTLPDDVHLHACGHHFHWQCLIEAFSVTSCPTCNTDLLSSPASASTETKGQVLCDLTNEGGQQSGIDILPQLQEEGYLKTFPEERKQRAFLEFCRQGDLEAVLGVLGDDGGDEESEDLHLAVDVLRYQDQLHGMQSALHAAVSSGSQEVVWVLLYLASELPLDQFPADLLAEAEGMGLPRNEDPTKADIRSLKDKNGRTAEQEAAAMGGVWTDWIGKGRLTV